MSFFWEYIWDFKKADVFNNKGWCQWKISSNKKKSFESYCSVPFYSIYNKWTATLDNIFYVLWTMITHHFASIPARQICIEIALCILPPFARAHLYVVCMYVCMYMQQLFLNFKNEVLQLLTDDCTHKHRKCYLVSHCSHPFIYLISNKNCCVEGRIRFIYLFFQSWTNIRHFFH